MLADERGSVVALADDTGAMTAINSYDEYGIPGASNAGAFQYTGMMWLSRPGVYAPTFRAYGAHLGRFNQTDPLGYAGDGPNLYAYVLDDPVNLVDPLGLDADSGPVVVTWCSDEILVRGSTGPACVSILQLGSLFLDQLFQPFDFPLGPAGPRGPKLVSNIVKLS